MRLAFLAILAGLLAFGGHATPPEPTQVPAGPPIPDTIVGERATDGYPVFVAAKSIFAKDGSYDSSVFSPKTIGFLLKSEERSVDRGCILNSGYILEHTLDPSNTVRRFLSTKLRQAFSAEVIASRFGISKDAIGRPLFGRVFQLRTLESLLGDLSKANTYAYIFFPVGTFAAGGKTFCGVDAYGTFPVPPALGHRVVVRTSRTAVKSADGHITYGYSQDLITEQPDGRLSYGSGLTPDPERLPLPASFEALIPVLKRSVDP